MSAVVGVDLSSRALDLVKLDETSNRAEWVRVELVGKDSWERTLRIHFHPTAWWDDVYLIAIEAPYGRGQARTQAVLNRVVGAVAASLPARLRDPGLCWVVRPDEWKHGLGLKAKPTRKDLGQLTDNELGIIDGIRGARRWLLDEDAVQNARDAYCLAMWARDTHAKAMAAA